MHFIFLLSSSFSSSNMGIWVFEHAQQTGLTFMLRKCHIAGLQCSLQIVSDTLNLNILNANDVLGVWGRWWRPTPLQQMLYGADVTSLQYWKVFLSCVDVGQKVSFVLYLAEQTLITVSVFAPRCLALLCHCRMVVFLLCSQTFAFAHFSFSCFLLLFLIVYPFSPLLLNLLSFSLSHRWPAQTWCCAGSPGWKLRCRNTK